LNLAGENLIAGHETDGRPGSSNAGDISRQFRHEMEPAVVSDPDGRRARLGQCAATMLTAVTRPTRAQHRIIQAIPRLFERLRLITEAWAISTCSS
jgi:hypothetical protein